MITIATMRRVSGSKWNTFTKYEIDNVKNAKLKTMPSVMPSGLRCPSAATDDERTIGKIGQMQGARVVTSPARNANPSSVIIV
jgi:hypothetical protein